MVDLSIRSSESNSTASILSVLTVLWLSAGSVYSGPAALSCSKCSNIHAFERLEQHVPLVSLERNNHMQSANALTVTGEHAEISSNQVASQVFGNILSGGLPSLYRGAYRLLGNTADAEDAVQDGLLAAYAHLDQFRGQSQMSTWLAAIVHNSARMQLRRRLRRIHVSLDEPIGEVQEHSISQRLADRRPSPEDDCRNAELTRRLNHFQTRLTPTLRKTFQLRDIDGLSIRETARILGVPHGTVKAQSARARKKLTQLMRRALRSRTRNLTGVSVRHALARM
jgi:RNA polymerase sigma-70 factor, ECF subfamily